MLGLVPCSDDGEQLSHEEEEEAVPAVNLQLVSAAPEVDTTGLALALDNTVVPKAATRHLQGIYAGQSSVVPRIDESQLF